MIEKVKIKNHIKQIRGITYGGNDSINHPQKGYLPVLRSNNINEGSLNFEDLVYVPSNLIKDFQLLKKGDLLITASTGSIKIIGKNGAVKKDYNGSFGAFCKVVRPLNSIEPNYLKHFFQSNYYRTTIRSVINGANINNIKNEHLDDLLIPFPNISTQQKIANILDKADELRQYNKQLVEKYDALTQSLFLDMFGDPIHNSKKWEEVRFSEVGQLDRGKSKHRPRNAPELLNGPYPLIQTGDIANSDGYITQYKTTYSEFGLKQSKKWPKGTLCITIAANIAKTGILNFDACFPDSVVGFVPNGKTNNIYVQHWMSFLQAMIEEKAPMAAQKNINLAILKNLQFMKPSINLQNQFAERVQLIRNQKQQAQEALEKSEALFQSLLQKAFKGELN